MIKNIIKKFLSTFSYEISKIQNYKPLIFNDKINVEFETLFEICSKESLNISKQRFLSLYQSLYYVYKNNINGDIVECGVFRGGSAMMMAHTMKKMSNEKDEKKFLWLYDTFEGMANAKEIDVNILNEKAQDQLKSKKKKANNKDIWAFSPLDQVKKNINSAGYEEDKIIYVKGLVEETLKKNTPDKISLLRLDTDFYESTKVELEHLYPKIEKGGIIIIDDYGHWNGCKKAVDDYFSNKKNIYFNYIDYSGIIGVKTENL